MTLQYDVVIQTTPQEVMEAKNPSDLNISVLQDWPSVDKIIIAMPEFEQADDAINKLEQWGITHIFVGHSYNVCNRITLAYEKFSCQSFSVRILTIWEVNLDYVDRMVSIMKQTPCDIVLADKEYDFTMGADIASNDILRYVGSFLEDKAEISRALFNPWGYIEKYSEQFSVIYADDAPFYSKEKCNEILALKQKHPENEFFGREYVGSRYHVIEPQIENSLRILDIACGSGFGTELLSRRAEFTLGVDYLDSYIQIARQHYPENEKMQFIRSDAQTFIYEDGEYFDLIVSLHTLEHVPDDQLMMNSLYQNLCIGGVLIAEVPLLNKKPLGVPLHPHHYREYNISQFTQLFINSGFQITKVIGACRGFHVHPNNARDAVQIHATK